LPGVGGNAGNKGGGTEADGGDVPTNVADVGRRGGCVGVEGTQGLNDVGLVEAGCGSLREGLLEVGGEFGLGGIELEAADELEVLLGDGGEGVVGDDVGVRADVADLDGAQMASRVSL
jgi:hypothetical protein